MTELSTATKARLEIKFEGKSYWLTPFELEDMGEIVKKLTTIPFEDMARQMEALGDKLTDALSEQMLAHAQRIADESHVGSPRFEGHLGTVAGVSEMLFLSLRRNHPDITRKEAVGMVTVKTLDFWRRSLDSATGFEDDDSDPTQESETESQPDQPTGD